MSLKKTFFCFKILLTVAVVVVVAAALLSINVVLPYKINSAEEHKLEITDEYLDREINCNKIIGRDAEELEKAKILSVTVEYKKRRRLTNEDYANVSQNCEEFIKRHKYVMFPLSEEEKDFPIAYSLVVHHKIDVLERLLRSIYNPQNLYCIHVDKKSPESFLKGVSAIADCFDNVFVASKLENVIYATWYRVQADLNCMKDLYARSTSWKYLINLCGQDFPIKTNLEIVKTLKALNGKNSMETEKMPPNKEVRWKMHYDIEDNSIRRSSTKKSDPPIDSPVFSGGAYIVVSRDFIKYVLEDKKVLNFSEWSKDTYSPDEFFWATLQRLPDVPGSLLSNSKYDISDMNSLSRFVKWSYLEGDVRKGAPYPPCTGQHVRAVCVFGSGDLVWLLKQQHLFANKFDVDVDPFAIHCLDKHLRHQALFMKERSSL
uniref:Glucosaminyl (N-acetyl) transferase 1 n=1 Tax=Erpetoichthys calabaricus TaxID=27687 RepID=A0A8C4RW95_ERPCA